MECSQISDTPVNQLALKFSTSFTRWFNFSWMSCRCNSNFFTHMIFSEQYTCRSLWLKLTDSSSMVTKSSSMSDDHSLDVHVWNCKGECISDDDVVDGDDDDDDDDDDDCDNDRKLFHSGLVGLVHTDFDISGSFGVTFAGSLSDCLPSVKCWEVDIFTTPDVLMRAASDENWWICYITLVFYTVRWCHREMMS